MKLAGNVPVAYDLMGMGSGEVADIKNRAVTGTTPEFVNLYYSAI